MKIDLYKLRYFNPDSEAAGGAAVSEGGETDGDTLAQEAYAEMDGQEPKKKEPPAAAAEPAQGQPAAGEGEPQSEEGQAAAQGTEGKEATVEGQQEGAAGEGKPAQESVVLEPIPEEKIQAFAEKNKLTFVQAREELEESQRLLAKYGNDPLELARASRNTQREYDRLKSEQQKPENKPTELLSDAQLKAEVEAYATQNAKVIVDKYRADHPKRTEVMDDEAVLEWAKDDAIQTYHSKAGTIIEQNKKEASDKRTALLATISAKDSKFMHDVKLILDNTPDRMILNPQYNVKSMLELTKGQRYDADMEANYQRGLKAGQETPKILGVIQGGGGTAPKKPAVAGKTTLSVDQKNRAYDQFPDSAPASAEALWADVYKEDLKKNPQFLN